MMQPVQSVLFRPLQTRFLDIPQAPLCYWLRERFFELLADRTLGDVADVCQGLATANDPRFVRMTWEVLPSSWSSSARDRRWVPFEKGGGYGRWFGHHWWTVDWQYNGMRIKAFPNSVVRNEQHYFKEGWIYSYMARGSLGLRYLDEQTVFSHLASAIFFHDEDTPGSAITNCRFASAIGRSLSAKIQLNESYVSRIPFPSNFNNDLLAVSQQDSILLKRYLVGQDPAERSFDTLSLTKFSAFKIGGAVTAVLHTLEGYSEHIVFKAYGLDSASMAAVLDETGAPAGWFPLIQSYDIFLDLPSDLQPYGLPSELAEFFKNLHRVDPHAIGLADLKSRLRLLYEAGPGARTDGEEVESVETTDEDDEQTTAGAHIPIPAETFIEELSQKLEIHPISVYWMLREGIENEGWRCLPEERRITADRMTVLILSLLGHRWPRQVEAGEPIPDWADSEGIIPLTEGAAKLSLLETLRKRMPAEFEVPEATAFEREFSAVMGKNLDQWLETEFFKHHTKQFKKRPIAWQMQSGPFSKKCKPAFACLVYTHKLDLDTFPKLRTQYVGPLRQRYETELHGIEAVPLDARSERQEKRRVLLENQIQELKDFDSRLEQIANEGFGPWGLRPALRQAAIDDAMLHLKAVWLDRLQETIAKGPLPEWIHLARETALDCPIEDWIADAFSHLAHHCSRLGPRPPDQGQTPNDPEATDLAGLIGSHSTEMIRGALNLGCNEWWQKINRHLFRPLREKIQALREEIKQLSTEANDFRFSSPISSQTLRDLDSQIRHLKAQIKQQKNQLDDQVSRAAKVREAIERWEYAEAETWEPWLAGQPLYDSISSLDGKQRPPLTVEEFVRQESIYAPDINDGVRVNIAPIQKAGLLPYEVLPAKDMDKAISDRIQWRSDERRWCREGKLPQPGWWRIKEEGPSGETKNV